MLNIIQLKVILFTLSFVLLILGILIFILNIRMQETSIGTWVTGFIFLISFILCKLSLQLNYPRARSSLLIACTLTIICGITAFRSYFQYRAFRELSACVSSNSFQESGLYTYGDQSYYSIGDPLYYDSAAFCLVDDDSGERIKCSCHSQIQRNCYSFVSYSCYVVYVSMPNKLLMSSKLACAALVISIVICLLSVISLRVTFLNMMDSVQASVSAAHEVIPDNESKVIYLDEAHAVDMDYEESKNDRVVQVQGFVSTPTAVVGKAV